MNRASAVFVAALCLWLPVVASTVRASDPPLNRFEQQIRAYEKADRLRPPAPGGTVFVGSSTFVKWTSLERDFASIGAINRGFGGSTIPEVTHYMNRIVTPYHPARVVLYAGTNDIADGHSGERVFRDFVGLVDRLEENLPTADIYFVSMSMAPSRVQFAEQYDIGNRLIWQYCQQHAPHLHYVDVAPLMRDDHGRVRGELFGPDHLHMNNAGYALWTPVLQDALGVRRSARPR
jgi:lysophospholipase L1-like esterase